MLGHLGTHILDDEDQVLSMEQGVRLSRFWVLSWASGTAEAVLRATKRPKARFFNNMMKKGWDRLEKLPWYM